MILESMTMKTTHSLALTLALSALCSAPFAAETKEANAAEKSEATEVSAAAQDIAALTTARQLAALGIQEQDPLALIVAARLLRAHPTTPSDATKVEGERSAEPDQLGSVDYLLAQAKEFSGGQTEVLALIEEAGKSDASRGAVGGARTASERVKGKTTDVFTINFKGGKSAEIAVVGGSGDLDCFVYDENGNLIDSDADYTSTCALSWTPKWTGSFRLKIRNLGARPVSYQVLTN
jgi:hypothetical protein